MKRSNQVGSTAQQSSIAVHSSSVLSGLTRRYSAIIACIVLLGLIAPASALADAPDDFGISGGHFYTQSNGFPSRTSLRGYAITDDDGIPFWTQFRKFGGVGVLGYPISQRFSYQGKVVQLTQRAALVYNPDLERVQFLDVFDLLNRAGRDQWLEQKKHIPRPGVGEAGVSAGTRPAAILVILDQSLPIKQFYESSDEAKSLLGLPTSNLLKLKEYSVMRFQRGALQLWNVDTAWAHAGNITLVNAGDVLKESGILPAEPMSPEQPPESVSWRAAASSRGKDISRGVATWYGASFHGWTMANGESYDMYDSSTAASNIYPMGTWLLVTSQSTGKSVEVRVTDRGAFQYPIVVDLSWAAFEELADSDAGVLEVIVEPMDKS